MYIILHQKVVKSFGFIENVHYAQQDSPNNKAKINLSEIARLSPNSISTCQRAIKELVQSGYLVKHSSTEYSLSTKLLVDFPYYSTNFKYGKKWLL